MGEKSSIRIEDVGILDAKAEAIVNAANSALQAGGGVCGVIFARAGYEELQAACDRIGHCDKGSAVITDAFGYPVQGAWTQAISACKDFINANPDFKLDIIFAIPTNPRIDHGGKEKFDLGNAVLAKELPEINF